MALSFAAPDAAGARLQAGGGDVVNVRGFVAALALLVLAFAPTLVRVVQVWWRNPEYSHGFLMPLVSAWLLWQSRDRIRALSGGTSSWAIPVLAACLLGGITGELRYMTSLAPFAFVGGLLAVILAFFGGPALGALGPALVPLLLACPLPGFVEAALTLPFKESSARLAVGLLHLSGIPAFLDGNMLHLPRVDGLWLADACSGIRSFLSLVSLALLACLVWPRSWALKALVVLAAVPIAIAVNGLRIWLTGWLSVRVSPEAAEGTYHFFEGFALFAVAGLLLWGFAGLLGVLFPKAA